MFQINKTASISIPLLVILSLCSCNLRNEEQLKSKVQEHIGLIKYDPKIDTLAFETCHEDQIYPYFHHHGVSFKGEKPQMVREYKALFRPPKKKENGYITIRFIVNCKGEAGRFRLVQMDSNYNPNSFSEELSIQLLNITKSLKGWDVLSVEDVEYDYIRYVTFKVRNSEIIEILP